MADDPHVRPIFDEKSPPKIVGFDVGTDDKSAALYYCAGCGQPHWFTHRPAALPYSFACECGNKITLEDPILRALPRASD